MSTKDEGLGFFFSRIILQKNGGGSDYRRRMLFEHLYTKKSSQKMTDDKHIKQLVNFNSIKYQELENTMNHHMDKNTNLSVKEENFNSPTNRSRRMVPKLKLSPVMNQSSLEDISFKFKLDLSTTNKHNDKSSLFEQGRNALPRENQSGFFEPSPIHEDSKAEIKPVRRKFIDLSVSKNSISTLQESVQRNMKSNLPSSIKLTEASRREKDNSSSMQHAASVTNIIHSEESQFQEPSMRDTDSCRYVNAKIHGFIKRAGLNPRKQTIQDKIKTDLSEMDRPSTGMGQTLDSKMIIPKKKQNMIHFFFEKNRHDIKQTKPRREEPKKVEPIIEDIFQNCKVLQKNLNKMDRKYAQSNKQLNKVYRKLDTNLDKVRNSSFPPAELILV